ncbi:MAG: hypothetical protein NTW67_00050 [Candidatus Woesearchaeota archaeon]|nr:hypothetical protein [Candidatus Woesearchaeota archaeon]
MDSHTVGIYGVLLAVVLVGVVGLYFTSMASNETTSVVYVGGGYNAPQITAWTPPFFTKLAEITKPFKVFGKGITGLDFQQTGTGTITNQRVFDLRMYKNSIACEAVLLQNVSDITLYTCNNYPSIGGNITCDGGDLNNVTNASTCSDEMNKGAFGICNMGAEGALNATLNSIQLDGVDTGNFTLYDYLYNDLDNDAGKGCFSNASRECNECNDGYEDCPKTVGTPIEECDFFDTSGQCLCECFGIHTDDDDTLHLLRNGSTLTFEITKTMWNNGYNSSADCDV